MKVGCENLFLVQSKSFGISKMKLDFQNIDWEFKSLGMDMESFWTKGYAGLSPNGGHELAIYVHTTTTT